MEGGRGSRRPAGSSSAGVSWATFEEKAKDYGTHPGRRQRAGNAREEPKREGGGRWPLRLELSQGRSLWLFVCMC